MLDIFTARLPELLSVTVCEWDVVPMFWFPNLIRPEGERFR